MRLEYSREWRNLWSILFLGDKESMRWQLRMGEFRRAGGGKNVGDSAG